MSTAHHCALRPVRALAAALHRLRPARALGAALHRLRPARALGAALVLSLGLGLAALTSGCVQYSGSTLAAKVRSWMSTSSFVSANNTLIDDVARAHRAASSGTALQLRTVCSGLAADAGTAYGALPSPWPALTATLNAADEDLFRAATLCSQAASVHSPSVARAFSDMADGVRELERARRQLAALGISWARRP